MAESGALIGDRYRLVRRLATGGMSVVWEGWDARLRRRVAVKQLHFQPGLNAHDHEVATARALREARITARLHHPNAVGVFDVVEHDGQPCLIMQYVPSRSLQQILSESAALPAAEVARIGSQLASALQAAHAQGIVHRDVKPGNVLIDDQGDAKLTDFGISHALGDSSLTATGMVTGTPAYLAPEVARGAESTAASDVFSLGSTLYAALEGQPPFGSDSNPMATLHKVASGLPEPPRRSGPLAPLLTRMLAVAPSERPTMTDISRQLNALHADMSGPPTHPVTRQLLPTVTEPASGRVAAEPAGRALPAAPVPVAPLVAPVVPAPRSPVTDHRLTELLAGTPAEPPTRPPVERPDRNRRTPILLLVTALVLAALVVGAVLLFRTGGKPGGTATRSSTATSAHPATSVPRTSIPRTPSGPTGAGVAPPTASASTPLSSSSAAPSNTSSAATTSAARLARAVTDYYALMPGNTDQGWNLLTPSYQSGHAGGRQGYDQFWAAIKRVTVDQVTGVPPSGAEAVITYYFRDGRVTTERTTFGFVDVDGTLKIDSSQVLSSQ